MAAASVMLLRFSVTSPMMPSGPVSTLLQGLPTFSRGLRIQPGSAHSGVDSK